VRANFIAIRQHCNPASLSTITLRVVTRLNEATRAKALLQLLYLAHPGFEWVSS
jgi:hypothetical protein